MGAIETGGCLCGKVRFTTHGPLREVIFCHCSQCRRQSGLYFAATSIAADRLDLEGEAHVTWFAASDHARRGFCSSCGIRPCSCEARACSRCSGSSWLC